MASATTIVRFFALTAALGQATASFSLNISGPSWDYTTKDLKDTTSQACKDAFSADINCDETLLKIVASMDPDFNPQSSDLQAMCTTTCSDSLSQYIENVKSACDQDGDLAGVGYGNKNLFQASVATVGEVFQYKYVEACSKSGSDYCFLTYSASEDWARTDFPCSDECAVKFYQNAHEQPGSAYFFDYFDLTTQSSWWDETFAGGWKTVVKCSDGGSDTSSVSSSSVSSSSSSTKTDVVDISSSTSSVSTKVADSTTSAPTTAMTSTASVQSAAEATSTTATSGASRLGVPLFFF